MRVVAAGVSRPMAPPRAGAHQLPPVQPQITGKDLFIRGGAALAGAGLGSLLVGRTTAGFIGVAAARTGAVSGGLVAGATLALAGGYLGARLADKTDSWQEAALMITGASLGAAVGLGLGAYGGYQLGTGLHNVLAYSAGGLTGAGVGLALADFILTR